jgi:hypothetical protein
MLLAVAAYTLVNLVGGSEPHGCDTIQPGHVALSPQYWQSYTVVRNLVLTRGDSTTPFGIQTETLSWGQLHGRPTLLDVLVFDTPRGKTVDSSWIDGSTLRPLRFQSNNAARAVSLDFEGMRVRGRTVPSTSAPTVVDHQLGVEPFEWNMLGLAIGALPLRAGYCAELPVYSDRFGRVSWYTAEVVGKTRVPRKSRPAEPVWEVVAKADAPAPSARYWVSQRHRVVSRVLVWEPGISIMYARD